VTNFLVMQIVNTNGIRIVGIVRFSHEINKLAEMGYPR
jgi:hypothetical protein